MKFSLKLLMCTMILMAVTLGSFGYLYVNYVFETSLEREIGQALDESSILEFAFETAALNVPAKYNVLRDTTVEQIASNLETSGQSTSRRIRFSDEEKQPLYVSDGFEADTLLLERTNENVRTYRVLQQEGSYYIHMSSRIEVLNRTLYLETMRDVSGVFEERDMGFVVYQRMTVLMLLADAVVMHLISSWLTKPIRLLTRATRRMAAGDYDYRARQVSGDELGQLTMDFNKMAEALEENIGKLEEEIRAREDFVGAFAHELKTPLTSIIGYADMLRSRKLDEETSRMSANYIFTEGKRLEAMSVRLLDIMVTRNTKAEFQKVSADSLFEYLREMFISGDRYAFSYEWEKGRLHAEGNLIKTVLVNLLDNACKASEPGGIIEVTGKHTPDGYCFTVRDYGIGIPKEEISKITQAFYMVDKSRARNQNGAGLGLSLCAEILALHNSKLKIESIPGEGTAMSFVLSDGREGEN
ncbi:MAG: HAMP domain-containing histidine kinase [Lachnospiraceae bacterium]|nr:HAMP domain-containing histidine kinase [Lachnospiraceae bacterium]